MALPNLTIIPAGAGSGKTHRIQTDIAQWIKSRQVDPAKVLAVTFTEAAAGELRQRIRAELIQEGMIRESIQLNEAIISTIHGFGLRILTDYCLEGGFAPDATLLTEEEQTALIRTALTITYEGQEVISQFNRYGYRYDFVSETTASEQFRNRVLNLKALIRFLGRDELDGPIYAAAQHYLERHYGTTAKADVLEKALHDAVKKLLKKFPGPLDGCAKADAPKKALKANYAALKRAENLTSLQTDWSLWTSLQSLQRSNRNFSLPDGYDDLADAIMAAAGQLHQHPGPLLDAQTHVTALFKTAGSTLYAYQQQKQQTGLLDYTDMLSLADRLLQNPDVLSHVAQRFDCLVIDEFQDTNPLQFSLLYRLHRAGIPTLIVGDTKQAIMRFQHADARLIQALQQQKQAKVEPMTGNWRTQKPLLDWINAMGKSLFGKDYIELSAQTHFKSKLSPLLILEQAEKSRAPTHHYYTALQIKNLLNDSKALVFDKKTGQHRPIKGRDIAVLHPRSKGLERMAVALRELGVAVRLEDSCWFESPMVQLLYYALSYVADLTDRHAALYLVTSECGSQSLQTALQTLLDKQSLTDPVLECLQAIAENRHHKTVAVLLREIIGSLAIYDVIATWPDGKQARANIIRLQAEAERFVNANSNTLNSAGIYGSGLKSFLAWLPLVVEQDDAQPHAQAVSENAVHLVTWHSSKGREWPVVAVCGLDSEVAPRFPALETHYTDFKAIDQILEKTQIHFIPEFPAQETQEEFKGLLLPAVKNDATCLLYVALTRAREQMLLEWPTYQLDPKKALCYLNVLVGDDRMLLSNNGIQVQNKTFKATVIACGKDKPKAYDQQIKLQNNPLPMDFRAAIKPQVYVYALTPDTMSPSLTKGQTSEKPIGKIETVDLGKSIQLKHPGSADEKGTMIHRALEILAGDPKRQVWLKQAMPELGDEDSEQITQFCEVFEAWLQKQFKPVLIGREVPILGLDENGSVVSGQIDLLVETESSYWILDYKSDKLDNIEKRYKHYRAQLLEYAKLINEVNIHKSVQGAGIVWIGSGSVILESTLLLIDCP